MLAVSVQYMQAQEQQRHNLNMEIQARNELEQKRKELQFQKDKFVSEHELNLIMSQFTMATKKRELELAEANAQINIAKAETEFLKAQASLHSANAALISANAAAVNASVNAKAQDWHQTVEYPTSVELTQQGQKTNLVGSFLQMLGRFGAAVVASSNKAATSGENGQLIKNNYHLTQNLIETQNRYY